ncbi:MAG TPA: NAD(P)-dependent oxidoreductase, partial [Anaeromyxobacteraceae bacterium]|nr:NAD(P)-dependent oxidoreductase [Anaeromyxobacteraceae bacterium]
MKVAIIGTGIMGTGVGLTLRKKGHEVTCWNRTQANARELLDAGAVWRPTPRQAAEGAEFTVILVWNEAALHAVLDGPDGLYAGARKGQVYLDMSTQLPATAQAEAAEFARKGAAFLDAPVHGTKGESRSGGLWIMVGGERAAYDRARPLFQAIGETAHYMGPTGKGCAAKLCGNHLVSTILAALAESLALAEKAGLDCRELIKLWGESDFRSPIIAGAGGSMLDHDFGVSFHLRTMVKDTELIRNYSESIGVPVLLSNVVHE